MEVDTQVLPILPLERAVILPHMAVTLSMESGEAKEALAAARAEEGLVLIVPRINGHYARVGTIAKIEDTGRLPNGSEVVVIRGLTRGLTLTASMITRPFLSARASTRSPSLRWARSRTS